MSTIIALSIISIIISIIVIVVALIYCKKVERYSPLQKHVKETNERLIRSANAVMKSLYERPYVESDRDYVLNIMSHFNIDKLKSYRSQNKVGETINKGDETFMCYKDKDGILPDKILYIVLFHEMAHMGLRNSYQHPPQFWILMGKIVARALEMGIINLDDYPKETICRCNAPIISKDSILDLLPNIEQEIVE